MLACYSETGHIKPISLSPSAARFSSHDSWGKLVNEINCTGRSITVRHKEHIRYIRNNNPTSAYATHILDNRHAFGPAEKTLKLLKPCSKGGNELLGSPLYATTSQTKHIDFRTACHRVQSTLFFKSPFICILGRLDHQYTLYTFQWCPDGS